MSTSSQGAVRLNDVKDLLFSLVWGSIIFVVVALKPFFLLVIFRILRRYRQSTSGSSRNRLAAAWSRSKLGRLRWPRAFAGSSPFAWLKPYQTADAEIVSGKESESDSVFEKPETAVLLKREALELSRKSSQVRSRHHPTPRAGTGRLSEQPQPTASSVQTLSINNVVVVADVGESDKDAQAVPGADIGDREMANQAELDRTRVLHLGLDVMKPWWSRMIPPVSDRLPIVTEDSLRYSVLVERLEQITERKRITLALNWIRLVVDLATCTIFYVEASLRRDYIGLYYYWPVGLWFAIDYAYRIFLLPHRGPYYQNHVFTLSAVAESLSIPSALRAAAGNISFVNFNFLRSITAVRAFFYIYNRDMLREDHVYIGRVGRYVISLGIYLFAIVFSIAMLMFDIEYASGSNHFTPTSSIYFTIVTITTVGYGDYVATNAVARIYVSIVIFIMVAYFAYAIANIVSIYKLSREGKGSFRAAGYRRHIVVAGRPSFPQLEAALSIFFSDQRNALSYFVIFLDEQYLSESQTNVLQNAEGAERVRCLVGNLYESYHRHRVDLENAEMCLLFSGTEPRDRQSETHRIADDASLLLRARTVRIHYPQLPLHVLFQTPYAVRQLEDLFIQSQPTSSSLPDHQLTADKLQAGLLEYETRTLCHLEFAAYLLAANVHCNGASTLIRNMLADPRTDRPLCVGDSLSIVEYKTGVRYKLRRISLPEHLAKVRLGDLALELYLRFEVALVGLLEIDSDGVWNMRYDPAHNLKTCGMLFVLCARYQFRPLVNWLYSKHAIDDLWETRKMVESGADGASSDTSKMSKQSRSSHWSRSGHVEVELPELRLYADPKNGPSGTPSPGLAVQDPAQAAWQPQASTHSAPAMPSADSNAFAAARDASAPSSMDPASSPTDRHEANVKPGIDAAPASIADQPKGGPQKANASHHTLVSDDESDEEHSPMDVGVILGTCSASLSTTFVELFAKALRTSASFLSGRSESSVEKSTSTSTGKRWERASLPLTVLVPSVSNENHFREIASKYGPMRHVAGSVLRLTDLARVRIQEAVAVVLVSNDTAQGFVEPETTFSGLEVFAMVNVDLLLRHYDCSVFVCAELSQHQTLEMVPAAAPRRILMPLGEPLQLRPVRRLEAYHPLQNMPVSRPSALSIISPGELGAREQASSETITPALVALRAVESQIVGDEGFRYRNRFASGEMTSTSIFATALITREHALPGVVLVTKSLLGMPVSRFDHQGRRVRLSRPHLHLVALPPALEGTRYVDLVELVIAAGGLSLGLYRSFHHEIRVSVADLHQLLLSRFSSGATANRRDVKPYDSVLHLVQDMASRRGLDAAAWIHQVYEPLDELDASTNHALSGNETNKTRHRFWRRLGCCWQQNLPYPNRILNLGPTQNSLPYVLTNPPPYVRISRYDGVYVVTEHFERFLSKFLSLCAQQNQE
jgi:hypothetical protein